MRDVKVCPRCANGRPICLDRTPEGHLYSHAETCATYEWAEHLCALCDVIEAEELANPLHMAEAL